MLFRIIQITMKRALWIEKSFYFYWEICLQSSRFIIRMTPFTNIQVHYQGPQLNILYSLYSISMYIQLRHIKKPTHIHFFGRLEPITFCWQTFALEAVVFVYPLALSTEAQFGKGWKGLRREAQQTPSVQRPHFRSPTAFYPKEAPCL